MPDPDPDAPASLFRSRAHWREEMHLHPMEEIGQGPLAKMVRIALSDPDGDLWPYAIRIKERSFVGDAIAGLRALANGEG